jgi:hypothetical protein
MKGHWISPVHFFSVGCFVFQRTGDCNQGRGDPFQWGQCSIDLPIPDTSDWDNGALVRAYVVGSWCTRYGDQPDTHEGVASLYFDWVIEIARAENPNPNGSVKCFRLGLTDDLGLVEIEGCRGYPISLYANAAVNDSNVPNGTEVFFMFDVVPA